ncbi:hypothetical protein Lpp120_1429 [Lacticaseibacillus paracasei subsp. paracasei Lpp120]|nr:hypothetical protein Lpp120_1429 [Lacticaseibacillus paracasei subsp. paracasei Lpp120]
MPFDDHWGLVIRIISGCLNGLATFFVKEVVFMSNHCK